MSGITRRINPFQHHHTQYFDGFIQRCVFVCFSLYDRDTGTTVLSLGNDEHGGWEVRGSRWFIFPQRESSFSQDGWSWYVQALFLNLGDFSMSWGINQDSYDFGEHVQWYVSSCLRFTMLLKVRFFITKSTTQAESAKNWYSKVILDLRQSCIISRGRVQGGSGGWQDRRHIYSTIDDKLIANKSRIIVVVIGVLDMEILISIGLRRSSNLCHTHHLRAYISLSRITQINICEVKWHQTSNLRLSMEIRIYIATSFSVLMTDVMNFNGGNHLQIRSYFLIKIVLFLNQQINAAKKALEVHQSSGAIKRQPLYEIYHSQNIQLFRNTIKVVKYTYYRLLITMAAPNNPAQNDDCANPHQTETNADSLDYCMVGRLLINRPVHFPSFRDRMADLWKPERKVNITKIDPNRFMFQFFSLGDMQRIYHSGPWLFDSFPLVMRRLAFGEDPKSVPLDTIEMWVQAHNLPFGFMSESMGILLGNHVGKLEKYDTENNFGNWRRFMRLRVAMNTDEPLKHSWQFERPDAEAVTVNFRYEKLGNFCYVCGVLGHTHNYCQKRYEEGFVAGERQWGPYLKAEFRGPNGDNVNPWLHDGRNLNNGGMQRQGGIARGAECNNIHRLVGRVKIGRNQGTRSLIFMRYTGAQSSTEWVQFSVANMPTTSVGVRPMQAHPTVTPIMQLASTGEEEGDDARIARLIMEARLKNPLTIEAQATGTRTADQITEMQQPISQLAASLSQVMQMGMTAATGPQLSARGTVDINIRDGPKQLKRLRLEEKEEGDEDGTATDGRTAIAAPIESDSEEHRESMICDPVLLANNNVMAGPGHQARQEK